MSTNVETINHNQVSNSDIKSVTPSSSADNIGLSSDTLPVHQDTTSKLDSNGIDTKHSTEPNNHSEQKGTTNIDFNNNKSSTIPPQSPSYGQPSSQQHFYYYKQQPNSPATKKYNSGTSGYDFQPLFFQQQQTGLPILPNPFDNRQQLYSNNFGTTPLSPFLGRGVSGERGISASSIEEISPLTPSIYPGSMNFMSTTGAGGAQSETIDSSRVNNGTMIAPPSPSLPYLSSPLVSGAYSGLTGMYSGYGSASNLGDQNANSPGDSWNERSSSLQQHMYQNIMPPPLSPQIAPTLAYPGNRRTTSFDEMIPPPAFDTNNVSGIYSSAPMSAGSMPSPHSWGGGYNPQQQENPFGPSHNVGGGVASASAVAAARNQQSVLAAAAAAGGHIPYFPAATPGPPIQTTQHNKGPDGANLFIFHIPNHFTNLDMWHLFCHYGNLLSVRIMVEKHTGRSRGFGFVSYDSPEAAALAIKELNGFVIGNKRLKVQHKQIRPSDPKDYDSPIFSPSSDGFNEVPSMSELDSRNASSGIDQQQQLPIQYHQPSQNYPSSNNDNQGRLGADVQEPDDGLGNFDKLRDALPDNE